jgi:paraquat-inducible protein A
MSLACRPAGADFCDNAPAIVGCNGFAHVYRGVELPAAALPKLLACHECDLVQQQMPVAPGTTLHCRRCRSVLLRHPDKPLDHAVAWSLTGLVLLLLANLFPVLNLSVGGLSTQTTLISGAAALYAAGQFSVAVLVVGLLLIVPALLFLLQIAVLLPLHRGRVIPHFVPLMRLLSAFDHWLMFDVFMLAILVAVVKLSSLAEVVPGAGLWAFLALMLASILSLRDYDDHTVWERYSELTGKATEHPRVAPGKGHSAQARGLVSCHVCGLVAQRSPALGDPRCSRCGAALHPRKTDSLGLTWAYLIAGYVLFVPANLLPITITDSLFGTQADTILSGVVYFWHEGAFDLAIIIFTASIFVPLAKLLALTYLAFAAQRRIARDPLRQTRLYRMVEFIGKWSMLDIFVVALLAQLVQFSSLAAIAPGSGAFAFAAMVVITMLATLSFDPRLLWDPLEASGTAGVQHD